MLKILHNHCYLYFKETNKEDAIKYTFKFNNNMEHQLMKNYCNI